MKRLTITYLNIESFEYDQDLKKKGAAFEDMSEYLRSCVKYDAYKEIAKELKVESKVSEEALDEITDQVCIYMREKLRSFLD